MEELIINIYDVVANQDKSKYYTDVATYMYEHDGVTEDEAQAIVFDKYVKEEAYKLFVAGLNAVVKTGVKKTPSAIIGLGYFDQ